MCLMEPARPVITVFSNAHVASAYAAFAQEPVSEPIPEIKRISLTDDARVEGGVNINLELSSVRFLQVIDLVESSFVFFGSGRQIRHVCAGTSYGHKVMVNDHARFVFS